MRSRTPAPDGPLPARAASLAACLLMFLCGSVAWAQPVNPGEDAVGIPGQQNLTLGSGARAFGMGGAFLARADDDPLAGVGAPGTRHLDDSETALDAQR